MNWFTSAVYCKRLICKPIPRKWTQNGIYTAKSAYEAQFQGTIISTNFQPLWIAEAEPKQRFLGWLILHQKILTSDNLLIRHWPCDWICSLCTDAFEDTNHLAKECSFTNSVWNQICSWLGLTQVPNQSQYQHISDWWDILANSGQKREKKENDRGAPHNLVAGVARTQSKNFPSTTINCHPSSFLSKRKYRSSSVLPPKLRVCTSQVVDHLSCKSLK